jgi:hypothetical protein
MDETAVHTEIFINFAPNCVCRETGIRRIRIRLTNQNRMTLHTGRFIMLFYAALMLIFVSCEDKNQSQVLPEGMGLVDCTLRSEIVVKSVEATSVDVADYNFRFVGLNGYATSEPMRFGDAQWPMPWFFGVYYLNAESCTREEAETLRGRLRYEGTSIYPFEVVNERVAQSEVTCSVANFQVRTNFSVKMYEVFEDYKLTVTSVSTPVEDEESPETEVEGDGVIEDGEESEDEGVVQEVYRTLDFTPFDQYGFYNLQDEPIILQYVLYVKLQGAEEFIPKKEGKFSVSEDGEATIVNAGDIITFNVDYTGTVEITDGIKFIVEGKRKTVNDGLTLQDYQAGTATEDQ